MAFCKNTTVYKKVAFCKSARLFTKRLILQLRHRYARLPCTYITARSPTRMLKQSPLTQYYPKLFSTPPTNLTIAYYIYLYHDRLNSNCCPPISRALEPRGRALSRFNLDTGNSSHSCFTVQRSNRVIEMPVIGRWLGGTRASYPWNSHSGAIIAPRDGEKSKATNTRPAVPICRARRHT